MQDSSLACRLVSALLFLLHTSDGQPLKEDFSIEPKAQEENRILISDRLISVNDGDPQQLSLVPELPSEREKRFMNGRNGLEGDTFSQGFGAFDTMKKRFYGKNGFHDDTFNQGFGDFGTMKRGFGKYGFDSDAFDHGFGKFNTMKRAEKFGKRGKYGFDSDTFSHGFGDFSTM